MAADNCCLVSGDASTCITDFSFFKISSQTGLSGLDGILGLSPASVGNGPSYLWTMYTQGTISSAEATFWINDTTTGSTVTFGSTPTGATSGDYIEQPIVS
jgi:hypothetical protein